MDAKTIEQGCRDTRAATAEGLRWMADHRNAVVISQDRPKIERILRRTGTEAERLQRTVGRPTCIGVFGPSQAGKSYLVSVLAKKHGAETMMAKFAGPVAEINFIKDINPQGGQEATGLVTRFTMQEQKTPEGFPVCLRLLSQPDIVKILVNSYFQDGDQEDETPPQQNELEDHLKSYQSRCRPAPLDALSESDLWDLREYLTKNSGGSSTAAAVDAVWDRIVSIAPRLPIAERGGFLSILWGRHKTYTAIFDELAGALAKLGFATDAFCQLDSLLPAKDGILNVKALDELLKQGADTLGIATEGHSLMELPRPTVAALASELRIVCCDQPHQFFATTDMLDFPGYRSREKRPLESYLRSAPGAAKDLFLRAKVDYLFQSYTATLELTSMLLCMPDSNLEVKTLPKAIENWITVTHGATPDKRLGKPTLLFFVLTKFDRHLSETAGNEGNPTALRFETRLNASLFEPFGKVEPSWPRNWTPGKPFDNLFWIRNPNFKSEHVINYKGWTEVSIIPERVERLQTLREAFVASRVVRPHFRDPERAWDEAMKLNDGGIGYLSLALGFVSTPDLKLAQINARLMEIRREAAASLRPYYVDDDFAKRRAARLAVVDEQVFADLDRCAEKSAFGTALRGLMVDTSELYGALAEALSRQNAESKNEPRRGGLITELVRGSKIADTMPTDKWDRIANAAIVYWKNLMLNRVDDPAFARKVGIRSESLKELTTELGEAARRTALAARIACEMRGRATPSENPDAVARKGSLVAERVINRFVSQLDFDKKDGPSQRTEFSEDLIEPVFLAKPVQFDTSEMPNERRDYLQEFMLDWAKGFRATVAMNAILSKSGGRDPQQNAKLGEILQALAASGG